MIALILDIKIVVVVKKLPKIKVILEISKSLYLTSKLSWSCHVE